MNNKLIIGIAIVIIIGGLWWMKSSKVQAPENNQTAVEQSAEAQLNSVNLSADVSSDFKDVDADLNSL